MIDAQEGALTGDIPGSADLAFYPGRLAHVPQQRTFLRTPLVLDTTHEHVLVWVPLFHVPLPCRLCAQRGRPGSRAHPGFGNCALAADNRRADSERGAGPDWRGYRQEALWRIGSASATLTLFDPAVLWVPTSGVSHPWRHPCQRHSLHRRSGARSRTLARVPAGCALCSLRRPEKSTARCPVACST